MKSLAIVFSLVAVCVFGGYGVAEATHGHSRQNVRVEKVIERVELREVPRVEKVIVKERVVDNHHRNNQNVERIIVRERIVNDHHFEKQRGNSRVVEKQVNRSRRGFFRR